MSMTTEEAQAKLVKLNQARLLVKANKTEYVERLKEEGKAALAFMNPTEGHYMPFTAYDKQGKEVNLDLNILRGMKFPLTEDKFCPLEQEVLKGLHGKEITVTFKVHVMGEDTLDKYEGLSLDPPPKPKPKPRAKPKPRVRKGESQ